LAQAQKEPPKDLTQLSLEELTKIEVATVYSASKDFQKVTEAPASVTIITADDIRNFGYRTLADILQGVRAFYVTYDRNYAYVGTRGFLRPGDYNSRILVLIDGHRLNDNVYDSSYIGTDFQIDVDLIDRVEVIRGPSSSLYGTSAFFGIVNVITKRGRALQGLEVSAEAASFGSYTGRVSYGAMLRNGLEMLYSGSVYDSRGHDRLFFPEFNSPATNNGVAESVDADRFQRLLAELAYKDFAIQAVYSSRKKVIPTASFDTVFNDGRTHTTDERAYVDLKYERTFAREWGVLARLYVDRYRNEGTYVSDYSQDDVPQIVLNQDFSLGAWWGGEIQVSKKLWRKHKVTVGAEHRDNFRQDQLNYDEDPFVLYVDSRQNSSVGALFVQDQFSIRKNLTLNAGVRYDHYSSFGSTTNPRVGLVYSPLRRTTFKLLYGQAFRAPNAFELYYAGMGSSANTSLQPETIRTGELVWEQYIGEHLRLSTSGFRLRTQDLINQEIDPVTGDIVYRNAESVRAYGVEFELEGRWAADLYGRISYAYQDTRDVQTNAVLSNSPRHLGTFNLLLPIIRQRLLVGFDVRALSKRETLTSNWVGGYAVADLTLITRKLPRGFEFSASVYNLFNRAYGDPGAQEHRQAAIAQDGRNFRIKLTHRLRIEPQGDKH
jgi:iron complex outermembrane receptor protein